MSKKRFFIPLAAFSLLLTSVVACNGNNNNNNPSSSNNPASSSVDGGTSGDGGASSSDGGSSSSQPVHTHDYNTTASSTVKNADQKDVSLYECKDNDGGKLLTIAFADYSEKSAEFSDLSGKYSEVPDEIKASSYQLASSSTISWKFNLDKAVTGAKVYFAAVATSSGHADSKLAEKYKIGINDGTLVAWDYADTVTYSDVGLNQTARTYVYAATFDLVAGENTITLRQGSKGDRLLFGADVRVAYDGEAVPVAAPFAGYDITFNASHCTILAFEAGQDYSVDPVALTNNKTKARDEEGNIVPYSDDPAANQPQVNFKVVPEAGYEVDTTCITISGTAGTDWNSLKDTTGTEYTVGEGDAAQKVVSENTFRVTKIKGNLTITVTAAAQGTLNPGYAISFNLEHCTVNVYKEKKFKTAETDAGPVFYSRNKNQIEGDYPYCKGENAQFSFVIVPEDGYEWKPNLSSAEVEADEVTFISPNGYNKLKVSDGLKCNLTKVSRNLVITITCTQVQA